MMSRAVIRSKLVNNDDNMQPTKHTDVHILYTKRLKYSKEQKMWEKREILDKFGSSIKIVYH